MNSKKYQNLSPSKAVSLLADEGIYLASESTIYRLLKIEGQLTYRAKSKPKSYNKPRALHATGPNQVYTWDITYL